MRPEHLPDKSSWGDGPWQREPDEVAWSFGDVPCRIVRTPRGSLNGYVGVPPSHPWHGKSYHDIDAQVHGGLTFADRFAEWTFASAADDPLWWVGFDCSHGWDLVPGNRASFPDWPGHPEDTYRDLQYVTAQTEGLARQAIAATRALP